jgi:predicted DNA-binding transcriptional regulator AlpA
MKLLTLAEVSELTRVPVATLRSLRRRGEGPRLFKMGGRLVADEKDVLSWIAESRDS